MSRPYVDRARADGRIEAAADGPGAAPLWRAVVAQTAMELRLTARRGENVLVTIVIPAALLVFFGSVPVFDTGGGSALTSLVPGVLALAVIATSLVNLGIATAYERSYGVLKRLGGTPLPRGGLVAAKIASVLVVESAQVLLLVVIAALMGWRPVPGWQPVLVVGALLLGTLAFAGLGLAMAGALRAEATLALANALFLVFLLLGGVVVPVDRLPGPVAALAHALPAAALSDALRSALGSGGDAALAFAILGAWGVGAAVVAVATFRWE